MKIFESESGLDSTANGGLAPVGSGTYYNQF